MAQLYGVSLIELKWAFKNNTNIPNIDNIFEPTELQKWSKQSLAIVDENNNKKPIDNEDVNYIRIMDNSRHVGGVLRTLAFTELLRYEIPKDWRNYNKKLKGIIQAITKSDYAEDYASAEAGVKNVTTDNYVVSSELIDFKFHQMTTAGAAQSFKEFNEALNNDIAIALLGNPNTTQLPNGGGSRAALQVQAMIGADIMFEDILNVQELINEQLIKADFEKNYSNGVPNWEFVIPTNLETDYQANAGILTDVIGNGIKVIKREVYQKIGYTMPNDDDEVFEPAI
jgi:phage gp29-like protein